MRVASNEIDFSAYVLTIGDGTADQHPEIGEDMIKVPPEYVVHTLEEIIARIFPDISDGYTHKYFVSQCAILTPKNDNVDKINEMIIESFPGVGKTYLSADAVDGDSVHHVYSTDFINLLTPSDMPPHAVTPKVGAPVMLLRKLYARPSNDLWNGTCVIILKLGNRVLEVEIPNGVHKGKHVLLPGITLVPSDTELPFTLKRCQFSIRPCFAMSTNKAHGQTLDFVGVYLPEHVFNCMLPWAEFVHCRHWLFMWITLMVTQRILFTKECHNYMAGVLYLHQKLET